MDEDQLFLLPTRPPRFDERDLTRKRPRVAKYRLEVSEVEAIFTSEVRPIETISDLRRRKQNTIGRSVACIDEKISVKCIPIATGSLAAAVPIFSSRAMGGDSSGGFATEPLRSTSLSFWQRSVSSISKHRCVRFVSWARRHSGGGPAGVPGRRVQCNPDARHVR